MVFSAKALQMQRSNNMGSERRKAKGKAEWDGVALTPPQARTQVPIRYAIIRVHEGAKDAS